MNLHKHYLLILLVIASLSGNSQPVFLSKAQFLEDLAELETRLKQHHPNLYTYQTPKSIEAHLANLREEVREEVPHREAYARIASLCSTIQDGHLVALPSANRLVEYQQTDALFPFDVVARGEHLFVARDYQSDKGLPAGTELLQINGMPAAKLIDFLRHRLPTDGPQGAYADWILNVYFRVYYFFFFSPTEAFALEVKRPNGVTEQLTVKGTSLAQVERVRKERFPEYAAALAARSLSPIRFDLQAEEDLMVLSISDWHRSVHRKAGQKFTTVIDEVMAEITRTKVRHLIIDLRDNQGGDLAFSHYLLRYLLDTPFQTVDHFARVKHPEAMTDTHRLNRSKGRLSRMIEPRSNGYRGKVYLLTNGGSFSNSGIFTWMIRKHKRGLILGSTTGGSSWQLCGGPNKRISLPNSGIQVEIPTTRYALHPAKDMRGGVVPDRLIQPTTLDLANGDDPVLNAVLIMIKSARNQ